MREQLRHGKTALEIMRWNVSVTEMRAPCFLFRTRYLVCDFVLYVKVSWQSISPSNRFWDIVCKFDILVWGKQGTREKVMGFALKWLGFNDWWAWKYAQGITQFWPFDFEINVSERSWPKGGTRGGFGSPKLKVIESFIAIQPLVFKIPIWTNVW